MIRLKLINLTSSTNLFVYYKIFSAAKKTHFNLSWLNDPKYANWVVAIGDSNSLRYKLFNKTFTLDNVSKGALESHKRGKTPKTRVITDSSRYKQWVDWRYLPNRQGDVFGSLLDVYSYAI